MDVATLTLAQVRKDFEAKKYSAVELAEKILSHIEKQKGLHAYLEVFDDVIKQAKRADSMLSQGNGGVLCGIPIAVKDNILIKGKKTTAGSKMLEHYTATYDATVIEKLKNEGAVFLGKTNLDEFAMGSSTENSAFGPTKNPHDHTRVPGGSSGGSAVAVASGEAIVSLGSDTGGSIRQPASFCGVVGLKPTYGLVSRYGLIAMGSSLDQIGPFAKTVEDAEILFDVLSFYDEKDSTSISADLRKKSHEGTPKKIGVPRNLLKEGIDDLVAENFEESLKKFSALGYEIKDIELLHADMALPAYYIIMPAEVSTNLSRFDGVRFGLHIKGDDLFGDYAKSRGDGFGAEVRRRILLGTFVLSAGYYDEYYHKAQISRQLIINDYKEAFREVDIIATPTSPTAAFKIGEKKDPLSMYRADIFTVTANLTRLPAISIPSGIVEENGSSLPVGIQLTAKAMHEKQLFSAGKDFEGGV